MVGEEVSWRSVGERIGEGYLKKNAGWCPRPLKNDSEVAGSCFATCSVWCTLRQISIPSNMVTNKQLLGYVTLTVLIQSFAIYSYHGKVNGV